MKIEDRASFSNNTDLDPFTVEMSVFGKGVADADISRAVTGYVDMFNHFIVQDGNHRSVRAYLEGKPTKKEIIGKINRDISQDPYYRRVSVLRII